jgi:fluoroquinolone transport system permease protein
MTVLQPGFGKLLGTELTLHYRNGLYIVYLVLTGFFLAIVSLVPAQSRETTLGIVILLDPAFIGFFFAGGLVLLEREQGILPVVATSAGSFAAYTRPKVVALVVLAAGVATVLLTVASLLGYVGPSVSGTLRLAIGLILAIPVFFNLGVIVAGWKPRVIEYFVYASFALLPLMIPLAAMAGVSTGLVGKLSPVWGAMILITSSSPTEERQSLWLRRSQTCWCGTPSPRGGHPGRSALLREARSARTAPGGPSHRVRGVASVPPSPAPPSI